MPMIDQPIMGNFLANWGWLCICIPKKWCEAGFLFRVLNFTLPPHIFAAARCTHLERPHTAIGIAGPSVEREILLPQFAATVNPSFWWCFFFDFTFHRSQQKQLERQVRSQPYPATIEIDLTFIGHLWCRVSSWPSSNIRATAPSKKLLALEAVIAVPRFPSIFEKASKPGAWNQLIFVKMHM